jgi:hypothetical protein
VGVAIAVEGSAGELEGISACVTAQRRRVFDEDVKPDANRQLHVEAFRGMVSP